MQKVNVEINDEIKSYPYGTTYNDIINYLNKDRAQKILAVKVNNELTPLSMKCTHDCSLKLVDVMDQDGYKMYQAALKFIFIVAVKEVNSQAKVIFEHSVPKGMLAKVENVLIEKIDVSKIKGKMASIIAEDIPFEKLNIYKNEAIKYFKAHGEDEKAKNIYNKSYDVVNMYRLKKELDYFYTELPYSTNAIDKFDIKYLDNNYFVLLCPSKRTNGFIPEYVHYQNIIDSFLKGKEWLQKVGCPYLSNINGLISSGQIKDFIDACELTFNENIHECAKTIMEKDEIKIVLIAGPSSSGKTTTCKRLSSYLKAQGFDPIQLSTDDYFVDKVKTPKNDKGEYDFECLRAIKLEEFNSDLNDLINGKEIYLPVYNFTEGKGIRSNKKVKLKNNSIILIEGLHCLNDDLTPNVDNRYKYKIYLSPFIPLNIDPHNYISTLDLRLLRRILRDFRTRGMSVDATIKTWQSVRDGEEKYIFPYIHQADVIINTALPYELNVLKVFVEPLLYSVTYESNYYAEARRLIEFLKRFYPVTSEYVSSSSILREFIGWKGDF